MRSGAVGLVFSRVPLADLMAQKKIDTALNCLDDQNECFSEMGVLDLYHDLS